ncbi:sensor histidine kinase [Usitatibacter palustris]|nr:sensor histidine kinase [Usitatibacter palustris]
MSRTALHLTSNLSAQELAALCKAVDFHPIVGIPGFQDAKRGPLRDLYLTLIWNTFLGIVFTGFAWLMNLRPPPMQTLWINIVVANFAGFSIHALFMLGSMTGMDVKLYLWNRTAFGIYTATIVSIGVATGFTLAGSVLELDFARFMRSERWLTIVTLSSVIISIIMLSIFFWRARTADAEAALERERQRNERAERETAIANLRTLQAQIEPHFLFNTLANVTSLIDPDPAKAKRMLETFIRFLRATLGASRSESTTLGAEKELIASFLDVLEVRMGPRLRYSIDVEPSLEMHVLPPMLLQPLVENAIRHGLEPKVEGGEVRFTARREGEDVVIEIADTGVGFAPATSGGFGLTNVRDRLRLLFGARGSLAIAENAPSGTLVTVRLPA